MFKINLFSSGISTLLICTVLSAQNTVGLIFNNEQKSFNGYTLFAPNTSKKTFLIDNEGTFVKEWSSQYVPGLSAYLLEDGHLLRSAAVKDPSGTDSQTGGFQKFAWDNTLIWEFYYGAQHHDIAPMPNGNVLIIINEKRTKAEAIQAGRNPALISGEYINSLSILEIKQTGLQSGEIVWRWNAWDHLIQEYDNSKNNFAVVADHPERIDINFAEDGSSDWLHTNSVAYNKDLDQIVISNRNTDEIWIIDHNTTTESAATSAGDLLYRWGNPASYQAGGSEDKKLFGQHDAYWIEAGLPGAGHLMVFNNGFLARTHSSVDEIIPPLDVDGYYTIESHSAYGPPDVSWSYVAHEPAEFNSPRYGGSQRLPNGNTLICNSNDGEFLEVTADKEIVWKYINPVVGDSLIPQGSTDIDKNQVFRCYKYGPDYPGLATALAPDRSSWLYGRRAKHFKLYNNYPNPFNAGTNIQFFIQEAGFVSLKIYNLLGKESAVLVSEKLNPGDYKYTWDAAEFSSGVYFYRFELSPATGSGERFVQSKKLILLK